MTKYAKEDLQEMTEGQLLDRMHSHMANSTIGSLCSSLVTLQLSALTNGAMSEEQIVDSFRVWVMIAKTLKNELTNPTMRGYDLPPPLTDREIKKALNFKRKSSTVKMPKGQTIN